ncbi:hypothetical protein ACWGQ4_09120 [Streptomyces sp. NPDC055721]|uniref:hypothetical protein n=1 Tax=Streptomyces sp. NPDC127132 TaxID=3345374 RepID=UPI00363169AE
MVMQAVLETSAADDFALWPVGEHQSYGYLVLNGELTPAEVGMAVIELSVDQVRRLVASAQQDVRDFLSLAGTWAEQHLPAHAAAVTAALARAMDLAPTP